MYWTASELVFEIVADCAVCFEPGNTFVIFFNLDNTITFWMNSIEFHSTKRFNALQKRKKASSFCFCRLTCSSLDCRVVRRVLLFGEVMLIVLYVWRWFSVTDYCCCCFYFYIRQLHAIAYCSIENALLKLWYFWYWILDSVSCDVECAVIELSREFAMW